MISQKKIALSVLAATIVAFTGCGGGSSSSDTTATPAPTLNSATLIDAAIQGLPYTCGTNPGITDASGTFQFANGNDCVFNVGTSTLHVAAAKLNANNVKITPFDITEFATDDNKTVRFMQLIQSLDKADDGKIDLSALKDKTLALTTALADDNALATAFTNVVAAGGATDAETTLVTAVEALTHFETTNAGDATVLEDIPTDLVVEGWVNPYAPVVIPQVVLSGDITTNMTLTNDKIWILDGLVAVKSGAVLTIEAGTTIAGKDGTGENTSYMIIDKGSKIMAEGTEAQPIIFTSKTAVEGGTPAVGQWGGLTIIGNAANTQVEAYEVNSLFVAGTSNLADNSGVLKYVKILNSGITMEQDKEINGLSLVGVGSGTLIDNITVDNSDDDGIEAWGGTVNMSNLTITRCTDDHFDIDDGYSGTVTNLNITTTSGNAGIEMSGTTAATFDGFNIIMNASSKEGAVYFKKSGIGGHFKNGVITNNLADTYASGTIFSEGAALTDTISFDKVVIGGTFAGTQFVNKTDASTDSADEIKAIFDAQDVLPQETLSGDITTNMTLTNDKIWILDGLVAVKSGAVLTIEAGTTIAGMEGTGENTSYMVVDKGSKIMAEGTEANPIIFTSKTAVDGGTPAVGQWGGLTILGNAANAQVKAYEVNTAFTAGTTDLTDNSGILKYVEIRNSGITMEQDKEINGLSLIGVGSGTTIDNITVDLSDDDGIEAWGGTVNMSNLTLTRCTDDYFDVDDGYAGTVTNLNITTTTGNAAMEMSGTTTPTFNGVNVVMNGSAKEGGMYFKGEGIGGNFSNVTLTNNLSDAYAYGSVYSDAANPSPITFTNVKIGGTFAGTQFVNKAGDTTFSADEIEAIYNAQ